MKVLVVAEFYPRADDPVLGIWAHRQALAARDAGADVRVAVLYRPIPPQSTPRAERLAAARALRAQPPSTTLDGLTVDYVRFYSPPRGRSYGSWGAWAARPLARYLRRLRADFDFDLIHAHNAVPPGDAARRARRGAVPLVVSVHGGDVFHTVRSSPAGARNVGAALGAAKLVLANSRAIATAAEKHGAADPRVLHLGTDLPADPPSRPSTPTIVSLGHLVGRKRNADVIRALWLLRDRHPSARYVIVGDGPERAALHALATELGLEDRVELTGQLPPAEALETMRRAHIFAMPSIDEAFGVAYIEAMAAGLPAIGSLGEPGPEEIAVIGEGMSLVPPADVEALAQQLDVFLSEPDYAQALGRRARETVRRHFTWQRCGEATLALYEEALR